MSENDESLPSHTIALKRAFSDCSDGIDRLRKAQDDGFQFSNISSSLSGLVHQAYPAAETNHEMRQQGINDMRRQLSFANGSNKLSIDVITVTKEGILCLGDVRATTIKPFEFKQRYCTRNIPCIIRGLNVTDFSYVSSQWRSENNSVNVEWFRKYLGDDNKVPVRIDSNNQNDSLDADGRATECENVEMKLCEWIQYCKHLEQPASDESATQQLFSPIEQTIPGYLKDWHLVQFLSSNKHVECMEKQLLGHEAPLYTVPSIFERDLLNSFLTRYTGGDYKFVYWGPTGSRTNLHSDVLHSFSWSFNVVGRKHWTFYIPGDENGQTKKFELIQETGDTIFVPAMWKHEVVNLVETLSINHNWITSANIDCAYECLLTEISSIEKEIHEWGVVSDDDFEARENMLRGCVGLDVSTLVIIVLLELIELLNEIVCDNTATTETASNDDCVLDCLHSIFHLRHVLASIMFNEQDNNVHVMQRLTAALHSETMASKIVSFTELCLEISMALKQGRV